MNITVCRDTSDAVALYLPQRLYLKSFAKLNISIQLPTHKVHGKSLSNWELMEKIRKMVQPESFSVLKVSKHSSEVIKYEAELEDRDKLERVLSRLENRIVQLKDYPEPLKVRVAEAKSDFPIRHSWDSFFRDATDMDEMKPGERPDTIHITNLPIRWFVSDRDHDEDSPPSENLIKKIFEKYGTVRQVDVPAADPYRMQMKAAIRGLTTPPQEAKVYFEAYIQYSEYVSFVRCMDALRGRKLLRKKDDIAEWCSIKVDFDKTKHMTDAAVKRRAIVRERLLVRQKAKDEEERLEKERISKREAKERQKERVSRIIFHSLRQKYERTEREKLQKMKEREERRKRKQLAKLMERDDVDLSSRVVEEKNKLIKEQKKLQAIRLIEELFRRIELRPDLQQKQGQKHERYYAAGERSARARMVERYKRQQEVMLESQREQLKCALDGRIVIRSALETKKPRHKSASSSSGEEDVKRIKTERVTTPDREMQYKAAGMYQMPYGYGYPFAAMAPPAYPFPPQNGVYQADPSMYYPVRGYYPPPESYAPRRPRLRGRGRGRAYMHYNNRYNKNFDGHDDRDRERTRSRSRSRSRRRSYSRSRSRSRRRSRSRSRRSRSRRSRSNRRSRSRSRRSR
ncbi:A-kinase anchor protein 17A isoform X1 [Ostrinia furnacalis]|uniref:A-kinase anchor protein 17A isoform X1 n=2 Tax=Ostrinia furnacalis TaxID=93504 RepID=UPI001040014C|nr:A-kinase anchor protein 17A isoform X1 [Ostrinia furnacalis]